MSIPQSGPAAPDPRRPPAAAAPRAPSAGLSAPPPAPGEEDEDTTFDSPGGEENRHDGFGPAKRRIFLKTLAKTGCVADGCRAAGISDTTAYNHRAADPDLAALWRIALSRAAADIELLAWERGVTGIEEPVYAYGKFSHIRVRRNDAIFLRLLEASNPKKYGRRSAPLGRKRILKEERKQMEREIRAKIAAEQPSARQVNEALAKALTAYGMRNGTLPPDALETRNAFWASGERRHEGAAPIADAAAPDSRPPAPGTETEPEHEAATPAGEAEPDGTAAPLGDRSPPPDQDAHAQGGIVDSAPKSPTSPPDAAARAKALEEVSLAEEPPPATAGPGAATRPSTGSGLAALADSQRAGPPPGLSLSKPGLQAEDGDDPG